MNSRSCASRGTVKCTKKQFRSNGIEMSPLNEVNETKPVAHIGRLKNFFLSKFKDYVDSDFEMFPTFLKLVLQYSGF